MAKLFVFLSILFLVESVSANEEVLIDWRPDLQSEKLECNTEDYFEILNMVSYGSESCFYNEIWEQFLEASRGVTSQNGSCECLINSTDGCGTGFYTSGPGKSSRKRSYIYTYEGVKYLLWVKGVESDYTGFRVELLD